ncbi:MAG: hypothetical protein OD817_00480 [Gammaproteobacteria bacterium]
MSLDEYLRSFAHARRVTLVGPLPFGAPGAESFEEPLIWVDGGADHRGAHARVIGGEGFAIGDGDSARGALDQYLPADKDCSDLAHVLRRLPAHFSEVVLRGFLGARRDHELFNLGEVHHFLAAAKAPARARFDNSVFGYSKGEWKFAADGVFSLAALEATTLQLFGACQYPLPEAAEIAPLTSLGLSNRGFGEITLRARGPVFIFMPQCNDAARR